MVVDNGSTSGSGGAAAAVPTDTVVDSSDKINARLHQNGGIGAVGKGNPERDLMSLDGDTSQPIDSSYVSANGVDLGSGPVCNAINNVPQEIWYDIHVTVYSSKSLQCTDMEWIGIKEFIERDLKGIDLDNEFGISDLKTDLCLDSDDDDEYEYNSAPISWNSPLATTHDVLFEADNQHRALQNTPVPSPAPTEDDPLHVDFNLFFNGGGRCFFCDPDDGDGRRMNELLGNYKSKGGSVRGSGASDSDDDADRTRRLANLRDLNLSAGVINEILNTLEKNRPQGAIMNVTSATTRALRAGTDPEKISGNGNNNSPSRSFSSTESNNDVDMDDYSHDNTSRELGSGCGECHRLYFDKNSNDVPTTVGAKAGLLEKQEYLSSHGVTIKAYAGSGCKTNKNRGVLIPSDHPQHAKNLGSPNAACGPAGGPGQGSGGKPKLPDGNGNPGSNCQDEHFTVLSIGQDLDIDDGDWEACKKGGHFDVQFARPVKLNRIGLMDVRNDKAVKVEVTFHDQTTRVFQPVGYGQNSIETLQFHGLFKVVRLKIIFRSMGGITHLDFCQDCDQSQQARLEALEGELRDAFMGGGSNVDGLFIQALLGFTFIENDLSGKVSTELNKALSEKFRKDKSHCLYKKGLSAVVKLYATSKGQAKNCQGDTR